MERTGAHSGKRWLPGLLILDATSWLLVIYFHLAVLRGTPVVSAPRGSLAEVASEGSGDGQRRRSAG